jgi:putative FmdB family regulatory protein
MPMHDYHCEKCGDFEAFTFLQEGKLTKCPTCRSKVSVAWITSPRVQGDIADWGNENRGKGRYCPQLASKPKDPNAYATSRWDLIDKGKRRGWEIDKDGDG